MGDPELTLIDELTVPGSQLGIYITRLPPKTAGVGDDVNVEEDTPQDDPQQATSNLITLYTHIGGKQFQQTLLQR